MKPNTLTYKIAKFFNPSIGIKLNTKLLNDQLYPAVQAKPSKKVAFADDAFTYRVAKFFNPNKGIALNTKLLNDSLYPAVKEAPKPVVKPADSKLSYRIAKFFNPNKGVELNTKLLNAQLYPAAPAPKVSFLTKLSAALGACLSAIVGLIKAPVQAYRAYAQKKAALAQTKLKAAADAEQNAAALSELPKLETVAKAPGKSAAHKELVKTNMKNQLAMQKHRAQRIAAAQQQDGTKETFFDALEQQAPKA